MKSSFVAVLSFGLLFCDMDAFAEEVGKHKAVLVTGASSGIGLKITETLADNGYYVYAGARKAEDLERLGAMTNVSSVRLDVTAQDEIDAVVEFVKSEGRGLYGLVNNAGVAVRGPLTQTPDTDLEFVFDVNVTGVLRVTRAFAPMIIDQQGRITTTGSISGILSSSELGVYSMSKHAVEAFTDSLARELEPRGVAVSVVEPGNFKSQIRRTTAGRALEQLEAAGGTISDEQAQQLRQVAEREVSLKEPDEVAQAVMHALFAENPKRRYMVVPNQREAEITIRKAIEEVVQLNEGHTYSYDRGELIRMLDDAMAVD